MNKEKSLDYTILSKIAWWSIAIVGTPVLFLSMIKNLEQKAIQHHLIIADIQPEHWKRYISSENQENTVTNDIVNNEQKEKELLQQENNLTNNTVNSENGEKELPQQGNNLTNNTVNNENGEKELPQQGNYLTSNTANSKQDKNVLPSLSLKQCYSEEKSNEALLHIATLPFNSTINGIKALKAFKGQDIIVKPIVSNCQKRLNNITQNNKMLFTSGHSKIHLQSYPMLDKIATVIIECETVLLHNILTINGHTDSRGDKSYNKLLSENRANSVKKYLTKQNINTKQMIVIGYGETKPISNNHTKKGRIENRRITFEFKRKNSILSKL